MSTPQATTAPLNDVMLAMDVVDTLRHRQDLVARELDSTAREQQLIERLREIYTQQGIEVTDRILKEGVAALAESRFVYTPPKPSFATFLARLYVSRVTWGRPVAIMLAVLVLVFGGFFLVYQPIVAGQQEAARIELQEGLPAQMDAVYASIYEETKIQAAVTQADLIIARGKTAAAENNRAGATAALTELTALRDRLRQRYTLQVVSRPGERTGVWTIPDDNNEATNYYILVEAIDADGKALTLPIRNEESSVTENVSMFGVRVPEAVYRTIEQDKRDDGIVQQNQLGLKDEGFLDVQYFVPVSGGLLTRW